MTSRAAELETFKTEINLVAFAEAQGFVVDPKKSSRTSVAMRHESSGERILVRKNPNGHYVYASVGDPSDNGTVIDFLQRRGGGSLGEIRKTLRPWVGGADFSSEARLPRRNPHSQRVLETATTDLEAVRSAWAAMTPLESVNPYLTGERAIPAAVYGHRKFVGRIRTDARRNVCFPHWERGGGLTGYEIKNHGFTGFAKGGQKRLFGSGIDGADHELVICETAIDLLSYAALHGIEGRRFVSTAGALSPSQPPLLRSAMEKLPTGGRVVLAVDADRGGDALCAQLVAILGDAEGLDLTWERHSPPTQGDDWNDVLRRQAGCSPPPPEPLQ